MILEAAAAGSPVSFHRGRTYVIVAPGSCSRLEAMERDDKRLLPGLLAALGCLAASALVLAGLFVALAGNPPEGLRKDIPGRQLTALSGRSVVRDGGLAITAFPREAGKYHGIAVWRGALAASDYALLRYDVRTEHPGPALNLAWRTAAEPARVHTYLLGDNHIGPSAVLLGDVPGWEGMVIEVGIYALGHREDSEMFIGGLVFEQHAGWRGLLDSYLTAWTGFRGWSQVSINALRATPGGEGDSPLPVFAAWGGLALLLLLLLGRFRPLATPLACGVVLLLPWIVLDLLWQRELGAQLEQTREQFGGKTMHQKHMVDMDSHIYRYIRHLKNNVLPEEPTRIIISYNVWGHNFERLKAQYYLLPHNVYNFSSGPMRRAMHKGDYFIVLGKARNPRFDPVASRLNWRDGRSVPVELVNDDPGGRVYLVTQDPPGGRSG